MALKVFATNKLYDVIVYEDKSTNGIFSGKVICLVVDHIVNDMSDYTSFRDIKIFKIFKKVPKLNILEIYNRYSCDDIIYQFTPNGFKLNDF